MDDVATRSQPRQIPNGSRQATSPPNSVMIPKPIQSLKDTRLSLSPVTQGGSYEFDRIIKAGEVFKRTRKTKVGKKSVLSQMALG